MMIPFLQQVARHYVGDGALHGYCFVFPNKRSIAFFSKWLSAEASSAGRLPLVAPQMVTVGDFFARVSGTDVCTRVELLLKLYGCYKELYPDAESLDDFIFWGDVILGDFDDVDKYLVDPKQLFTNVADFKSLQDSYSYMTERQREAVESFVGHFRGSDEETAGRRGRDVKGSFLRLWNILLPLYGNFRASLAAEGKAYEGMVYRDFAERLRNGSVRDLLKDVFPLADKFVFVGLNALNECEKTVMRKMRDASLAEFCWDYSGKMIRHKLNRSSHFMDSNISEFRQAFEFDPEGVPEPEFNVVSVPSSAGQVKVVSDIIDGIGNCEEAVVWERTAVVLPDEGLLMPMLESVPEKVEKINVTMGYPMGSSEFYALMRDILRMQMHLRCKNGVWMFYHKQVWDVFSSGIFKRLIAEDANARDAVAAIRKGLRYYIPQTELSANPLMSLIFRPVVTDLSSTSEEQVRALAGYQADVISAVASAMTQFKDMALELDFAKEYYLSVRRLSAFGLSVLPATYVKLLDSLLSSVSVPFKGEPLVGLQVMGPLETRALDFDNVIILSANEGVFPRHSVSSSFIPPELRRAFSLPTYEYQDSVWAYYFYRMVSRAKRVWMLYDSRTEGIKSGEESRYIKQLRYHFNVPLNLYVAKMELSKADVAPQEIEKTGEDVAKLRSQELSPSALQSYIDCPAKFYYQKVVGLSKEDEVSESMDASMIGNVYHKTMEAIFTCEDAVMGDAPARTYEGMSSVSADYLKAWLKREKDIKRKVRALICRELQTDEVTGRDLVVAGVIVRYVIETIKCDIETLRENGRSSFEIIGLEKLVHGEFSGFKFKGYIDRLDSLVPGKVRVVDYKTGKDDPSVLGVTDEDAAEVAEVIFGSDKARRKKYKAGLQFYLYDRMLEQGDEDGRFPMEKTSNSMYSVPSMFSGAPGIFDLNMDFASEMGTRLERLLGEIADTSVPFSRTDDSDICKYCDFKMICGR